MRVIFVLAVVFVFPGCASRPVGVAVQNASSHTLRDVKIRYHESPREDQMVSTTGMVPGEMFRFPGAPIGSTATVTWEDETGRPSEVKLDTSVPLGFDGYRLFRFTDDGVRFDTLTRQVVEMAPR